MRHFLTGILLLFSITILAQNQRPVVGLALSGGGAKGFAHIGILKIIDSLGIPVDYVSGTSMGAIVGGLYSIGHTPQEIEQAIIETDWSDLMNPIPSRKYELYSSKDLQKRNLFTLGFKDWKVKLPEGLNSASKVYQKFSELTIGFHGEQDFMEFPRGFVCIAADINTGQPVIFKSGSLPDAMRASMSIPTMFTPHKYGGHTMIDGGTINNFPTDELLKLGCDIIIGVDLQTTIDDTTNLSLTKILEKSAMFINRQSNKERQELCDVLIKPVLTGYTAQSFGEGQPIIDLGANSARLQLNELVELSQQFKQYDTVLIRNYNMPDTLLIREINVKGLEKVSSALVTGTYDITTNTYVSMDRLEDAQRSVYGTEYFDKASFQLLGDTTEGFVLNVRVKENTNDIDIGVGIRHDPDFSTSLLLNLAARNVLLKGSRINVDLVASERPRFRFLYEVDKGVKPGFGLRSNIYFLNPKMYNENGEFIGNLRYDDWTTGIYALSSFANKAILRIGGEFNLAYYNAKDIPEIRDELDPNGVEPDATKFVIDNLNLFMETGLDLLDDYDFPTRGHQFFTAFRYHTELVKNLDDAFKDHYITLFTTYKTALTPFSRFTIIPEVAGGWSFINDAVGAYGFNMGGLGKNYFHYQTTQLGYRYWEINNYNFVKTGLELRYNLFGKHYFSAMAHYTAGNLVWEPKPETFGGVGGGSDPEYQIDFDRYFGYGFRYSIDTFLGPIELTAHKNTENGVGWLVYFNLGFWF